MRIVYIAAGAAGSYCGACLHDVTTARGLVAAGHEVEFIALYTPVRIDREDFRRCPIFYGGINAWLQQHSEFFRRMPEFLDRVLDCAWLLETVGRFAVNTRPEDLGAMTVSALSGPAGKQRKELRRLSRYLASRPRPDVIHIANSLLVGLAPTLHERLGAPVVSNLQGEEEFVARLGEPWTTRATELIRDQARSVAAFAAPYPDYAQEMSRFLAVPPERVHVIPVGIDPTPYSTRTTRDDVTFRIGYLGRLSPVKGLDLLVDAFTRLAREGLDDVRLAVAGQSIGQGGEFWKGLQEQLVSQGLRSRVEFVDSPDLAGKARFLGRCDVFVLPSRVSERLAVSALEAMSAGAPVVVPDSGVFPYLIETTGGGVLFPARDVEGLVAALRALHADRGKTRDLGDAAYAGVRKHFSADDQTRATLDLYHRLIQ